MFCRQTSLVLLKTLKLYGFSKKLWLSTTFLLTEGSVDLYYQYVLLHTYITQKQTQNIKCQVRKVPTTSLTWFFCRHF